ncbi:hypothetical protein [Salmonirosea aquatica]|uniref:Uncharacterized protein n=1 Tax=Salmonirosea aquatica TaxID=2654236 RepID=A0A7C9FTV6_9BACT|nr:hypothetical protein [Cytophagaceae bacterium SJW1-29]
MSDCQKENPEQQFWNFVNIQRCKIGANELRDHILESISNKYLSEQTLLYTNDILKEGGLDYIRVPGDPDRVIAGHCQKLGIKSPF